MMGNRYHGNTADSYMSDRDREKEAKTNRENQQIIVYICIALIIANAWVMGTLSFSFVWVFLLIVLTFAVWKGKVMRLTEEHIKHEELVLHRKRALRQSETAEWVNFVINRWWVFSSTSISDLVKKNLDPVLNDIKPAFLEHIELHSLTVGEKTPYIKFIKVFEFSDGVPGCRKPASWSTINHPPPGLPQVAQYQIILEADVGLQCDEFKMVFRTRFGGKWMGMNLDVAIEKLNIQGQMQMILHMNMDTAFPHISNVTVSFQEKPEVWFSVRLLKTVQMMEIPFLKSWIHSVVMDGLTQALVDPGKLDFKVEPAGPTYMPAKARNKSKAQGVMTVTISGEPGKGSVFTDDIRYCVLRLGEQRQNTSQTSGTKAWQDTCSFLIYDLKLDRLIIKSKSKRMLSTYTLTQFDIPLSNFPLEHQKRVDTSVEKKVSKWDTSGTVKLDLTLEYTSIASIETMQEQGDPAQADMTPVQEVAGVLYVCVHSANNLLALDRNGTSDPYCIIFNNGRKVKTTHYICRTRNPTWEVSTEFIVGDFTKTMLSFLVYDWDGRHATEDDFLGSAYAVLSKEEPLVIKKSLTLGYNLLNHGQVDNLKLGNIVVTAIFRPVPSVAKSEEMGCFTSGLTAHELKDEKAGRSKNFMSSAKQRLTGGRDRRDSMCVGDLLSLGHGILELNILRAKDLVPMDSNGFSDPFCDVKIGNERKFTTSIKKKTLNPVWDEWVTMQLPKPGETLEIVVWDRDPFFRKDFLGCVNFTLEDLKRLNDNETHASEGWFPLQKVRSGQVQLHFKVIAEYLQESDSPFSMNSDGTDSGKGMSTSSTPTPSPREDAGTKSEGQKSQAPSASVMSPIRETGDESDARPGPQRNGISDKLLVASEDSNDVMQQLSPDHNSQPPDKKKKLFPLKRSSSDVSMKRLLRQRLFGSTSTKDKERASSEEPPSVSSDGSDVNMDDTRSEMMMNTAEKYYGVHCKLLRVQGLPDNFSNLYLKVRLDNRSTEERSHKVSQGHLLCKCEKLTQDTLQDMQLTFDVDAGRGAKKESLLMFDFKNSRKSYIASKGYTLQHLLSDSVEVTKWVSLGKGISMELSISHGNILPLSPSKSRRSSFLNMGKHKVKDS